MGALPRVDTAIIGGSGLYAMAGLDNPRQISVGTPFGPPSDLLRVGRMGEKQVAFLARHGAGHRLLPTEIDYRASLARPTFAPKTGVGGVFGHYGCWGSLEVSGPIMWIPILVFPLC